MGTALRCLVPITPNRVPALLLVLLSAGLLATCEPSPRIEIVTPRRGTVLATGELTVVWRMVGEDVRGGDHYHVFLDRDLPAVGDPIPLDDPHIVHVMGDTTHVFPDVDPGPHRVTVVLGDASHRARGGIYRASVPFRVRPH